MRRCLPALLWLYLGLVAVGVFGPEPGKQVDQAGEALWDVASEIESRLGEPGFEQRGPDGSRVAGTDTTDRVAGARQVVTSEEVFNILMFVPLGLLLPACWPRSRWLAVPIGMALSSGIEIVQGEFLSWRSQTLIDIQMNSLGIVIGFGIWLVLSPLAVVVWHRRAQPSGNIPRRGSSV